MDDHPTPRVSRRSFMQLAAGAGVGVGLAASGLAQDPPRDADGKIIPGFEKSRQDTGVTRTAEEKSDRKIRVGIAGYGLCRMGAAFSFQNHPNVTVAAVTDLIPRNRAGLAQACRCSKTYDSCEEMLKDDSIEAVFVATDAPSHARLSIEALNRGKHVACAVPAVFGAGGLEQAEMLLEAVKKNHRKYSMFETSSFNAHCYDWRKKYAAGAFGKLIYSEGEYYHYFGRPLGGYNPKTRNVDANGWRKGLPPQWYPTHSNAYYAGVSGGRFTKVSCLGMKSIVPHLQAANNDYKNPFGSEIALMRTSEGGMARMAVCWDMPSAGGERGRVYGQKNVDTSRITYPRPPLPNGVAGGGHGGSHGYLGHDFIESILFDRQPTVGIEEALNMTVAGIISHKSALKDGQWMTIPEFRL